MPIHHDYRDGLLTITATGLIGEDELRASFEEVRAIIERTQGPIISLLDASQCEVMKLKDRHRDIAIAGMKTLREVLEDRHRAHAIVLSSMLARTLCVVAYKLVRPADEAKAFGDRAKADAWLRGHMPRATSAAAAK